MGKRRRKSKHALEKDDKSAKKEVKKVETTTWFKKCTHAATAPIKIGGFDVWFGACNHVEKATFEMIDVIVPLNGYLPKTKFGQFIQVFNAELQDRGGVPEAWGAFIKSVVDLIKKNYKVIGYCTGGHGRTGTFGASLIAVMEPEIEDPVEEFRKRHCVEAVESLKQVTAIFALKGKTVPQKYEDEFSPKAATYYGGYSGSGTYANGVYYPPSGKGQMYDYEKKEWVEVSSAPTQQKLALPPVTRRSKGLYHKYEVETYSEIGKLFVKREWGNIF